MFNSRDNDKEMNNYIEILNKLLEAENKKKNPLKVTICVVGGLGSIMFIAMLCYSIMKSDFSLDSILSMLLAFFLFLYQFSFILKQMKQVQTFIIRRMSL